MKLYSLVLGTTLFSGTNFVSAQPYQFELQGGFSRVNVSVDGFADELESDIVFFEARYFLQPVDHGDGPLSERAFLDKAASVALEYSEESPDIGESVDTIGIDARFVTSTDTIISLEYITVDTVDDRGFDIFGVGVGRYLDNQTTFLGMFQRTDVDDAAIDSISLNLRKVEEGGAVGSVVAYEGSFGILMVSDDFGNDENGFEFVARATYFPTEQLGIGGGLAYRDIDDFDSTIFGADIEYFLNEPISLSAGFERRSTSLDIDTDILLVGVAARF